MMKYCTETSYDCPDVIPSSCNMRGDLHTTAASDVLTVGRGTAASPSYLAEAARAPGAVAAAEGRCAFTVPAQ